MMPQAPAVKPADVEIRAQDAADEPHDRAKFVAADQRYPGCNGRPDTGSARRRRAVHLGPRRQLTGFGEPGVEMPLLVRLLAFPILLALTPAASAGPAFETKAICRTAIAVVMDRDPKTLQTSDAPDGVVVLTYA